MEYAPVALDLTVRAESDGSRTLSGSFPYNSKATLSDGGRNGGRPKKESIQSGAFDHRLKQDDAEIHLLMGHDFDRPLASRLTDTLDLKSGDKSLDFEAKVTPEVADTSHGRDALALVGAGLAVGVSPGFRVPPQSTVSDAEETEDEDPSEGNAVIRTIKAALLYELSIVSRPAYEDSEVEARAMRDALGLPEQRPAMPAAWRWR